MMANLVTGKGVDVSVHFGHEANRKTFARETRVNRRRCTLLPDNGSDREQHKGFGRKDAAQNTTIKIHHPVENLRHFESKPVKPSLFTSTEYLAQQKLRSSSFPPTEVSCSPLFTLPSAVVPPVSRFATPSSQ
jgi:hypothetical protein